MGKTVEIKDGAVTVGGITRRVDWRESKHPDCNCRIKAVETMDKGLVTLEDGSFFENCTISSLDEVTTSVLVSGWIKDAAVTGDERLTDRPECERPEFSNPEVKFRARVCSAVNSIQSAPRSVGAD